MRRGGVCRMPIVNAASRYFGDSGMVRAHTSTALAAFTMIVLSAAFKEAAGQEDAGGPARGAIAFVRQCALCHTVDKGGPNRFGPNLFGITERKAGTMAGYDYSLAFMSAATWTRSESGVASFIAGPEAAIPGNKMGVFEGVSDKDGRDIVAFLATQK
jgi:cytochrome c